MYRLFAKPEMPNEQQGIPLSSTGPPAGEQDHLNNLPKPSNFTEDEASDPRINIRSLTLHQAARDGNVEKLRLLLESRANVKKINAHDENRLTAMHYAARFNHYDVVQLLLSNGADPNNRGEDDVTPLHHAVRYKRIQKKKTTEGDTEEEEPEEELSIVRLLVSKGADVNAQDQYGLTPLHYAAMRGNEVAVLSLLKCDKIDIEACDRQMITPIHMASSYDHYIISKLLIRAGANLRCADEDGSTPLHLAASEGNKDIVRLLFQAGERKDGWVTISSMITDQDSEKSTALHLAVANRHYEVVKMLLEKGADVNSNKQGFTSPLHLAASAGDVQIVKLLLDYKGRINANNSSQATPLHRAAAYNHCDVIRYLLSRCAGLEETDSDSFTPLLTAASYGNADAVKLLLSSGAWIKHVDKNEKSALFWAAEEDNVKVVRVILDFAAEESESLVQALLEMPDRFNNTPLHVAAEKGYLSVVKELLDREADMDAKNDEERTPLHLAAIEGRVNVCKELVRRNKFSVHDEDENSDTPLHDAAKHGHHKVAAVLLDAGADVEARNSVLWTPLDCAAAKGFVKVAKTLVDEDAPIDASDRNKVTPLHLASQHGHVDMVHYLLKSGAQVSKRTAEGYNALDLAIDNNCKDVALVIVKSDHWETALRNDTVDLGTGLRNTPMRKLIRKMPDVAEQVFYRCSSNGKLNSEHPNFSITFNYEFLDDIYSNWTPCEASDTASLKSGDTGIGSLQETYNEEGRLRQSAKTYSSKSDVLKENSPLKIMVNSKREDLLGHPLVTALLRHKWTSYGIYVYYLNLSIYLLYLFFLTGYMITSAVPFTLTVNKSASDLCDEYERQLPPKHALPGAYVFFIDIGKYIVMAFAALFLLRELIELFLKRMGYFNVENLLEWAMYILSILFVLDFYKCQKETGFRTDWQWQIGVVAVFLAWIDLVLFIRKLPRFGIYVVMFTDILKTFLNFFIVFLLFIIAFGLAFYGLLRNQDPYQDPLESLLKTAVMMTGEFEYDAIFNVDGALKYPAVAYPIFILFLLIMSILLMNLLVGLAVDDIKSVQEKATLKRMAMQIELALDVESRLPRLISRRFVMKYETIYPNRKGTSVFSRLCGSAAETSSEIAEKLAREDSPIEVVQDNQEKMEISLRNLKSKVKAIQEQNTELKCMIKALMEHNDVQYNEDEYGTEFDGEGN